MKVLLTSLAVSMLGLAACMDAGESPQALGDTEEAVTATALKFSSCPDSGSCDVTLVSARSPGWMCFLAGITGDLADGWTVPAGAYVEQQPSGGWILHILNPNNNAIGAMTTCVPVTGKVTTDFYPNGFPNGLLNKILPGTATTRCFLSGIRNYNDHHAFSNFESNVSVLRIPNSDNYLFAGNFPTGFNVRVDAVCGSIPSNMGDWLYGNGTAGTKSINLAPNKLGGVACGLTGVGGSFPNRDTNDGVLIEYLPQDLQWGLVMSPWKGAWAECVR